MDDPREVTKHIHLTAFLPSDKPLLVEYLKEKEIYDNTLRIPFPYTSADADFWLRLNEEMLRECDGQRTNFAIRQSDGLLLGSAGYNDYRPGDTHKAEIGYWLAKPFWGKGIMSLVVNKLCDIGFREFGLKRITASTFSWNQRSQSTLLKCGFVYEGTARNYYVKDGKLVDGKIYAKFPA